MAVASLCEIRWQEFDGDRALEARVRRREDDAHASAAELADDLVETKQGAKVRAMGGGARRRTHDTARNFMVTAPPGRRSIIG